MLMQSTPEGADTIGFPTRDSIPGTHPDALASRLADPSIRS